MSPSSDYWPASTQPTRPETPQMIQERLVAARHEERMALENRQHFELVTLPGTVLDHRISHRIYPNSTMGGLLTQVARKINWPASYVRLVANGETFVHAQDLTRLKDLAQGQPKLTITIIKLDAPTTNSSILCVCVFGGCCVPGNLIAIMSITLAAHCVEKEVVAAVATVGMRVVRASSLKGRPEVRTLVVRENGLLVLTPWADSVSHNTRTIYIQSCRCSCLAWNMYLPLWRSSSACRSVLAWAV